MSLREICMTKLVPERPRTMVHLIAAKYGSSVEVISALTSNKYLFVHIVFDASLLGGLSVIASTLRFSGFKFILGM